MSIIKAINDVINNIDYTFQKLPILIRPIMTDMIISASLICTCTCTCTQTCIVHTCIYMYNCICTCTIVHACTLQSTCTYNYVHVHVSCGSRLVNYQVERETLS